MSKLHILNRGEFVNQLVKLVENISENKSTTCFAINGVWGSGKSFVMDMFEEALSQIQSEETNTNKYFVIRYNSWKYDYYEEPLIAIVAMLTAQIEEKTKILPNNPQTREILGMLKATGVVLFSLANTAIKDKIGVDIQGFYNALKDGKNEGAAAYEQAHEYDVYFSFNKVMEKLASILQKLAKDHTVIFLVDELDRCLPEYAIKVLERLHHMTEDCTNIITILAIDKEQLKTSVKHIFGFENPDKYLEKFINFEVKLDNGTVSERISEKYADYFALFDRELFPFEDSVEDCLQALFMGVDIRTQEQLVQKVMLVHKLLYSDKKDYSFMCMELLLAIMIHVYDYPARFSDVAIKVSNFDKVFTPYVGNPKPAFVEYFKERFGNMMILQPRTFSDEANCYKLPTQPYLSGAILFTWYWMHKQNKNEVVQHIKGDAYSVIANNHEGLLKFAEMIRMMK